MNKRPPSSCKIKDPLVQSNTNIRVMMMNENECYPEIMASEKSALLSSSGTQLQESRLSHRPVNYVVIFVVLMAMATLAILMKEGKGDARVVAKDIITTELLSKQQGDAAIIKCDDILLGVWVETCFVVSDPQGVFPGKQGVLSYPIIILRAHNKVGFDLYGYSIRDPFFGGNSYWELSHGFPSRVESPTPTSHCVARFKSKLLVGDEGDWNDDDGDYYWNRVAHDTVFSGNGKDATCHFRRLYGSECRQVRDTAIERFEIVNVSISLPDESELCG